MKFVKIFLLAIMLCYQACSGTSSEKVCPDSSCDKYATQTDAQAAYDADRDCLGGLDNDSDGIACEHLAGSGSTGCPTTSNCGCSNKNKSQCDSDCCKWVTGTGCVCK